MCAGVGVGDAFHTLLMFFKQLVELPFEGHYRALI